LNARRLSGERATFVRVATVLEKGAKPSAVMSLRFDSVRMANPAILTIPMPAGRNVRSGGL
jgi:hypothetical protein